MERFRARLKNFRAVGPQVHRVFRRQAMGTFHTRGRNIGYHWPGYTGSERVYGEIKKAMLGRDQGSRLLRWENGRERLYPSVVSAHHPEHVWRVEGDTFVFGTRVPYAGKHQRGEGRGPAWAGFPKIKKRPFLAVNRESAAQIRRIMLRWIGI